MPDDAAPASDTFAAWKTRGIQTLAGLAFMGVGSVAGPWLGLTIEPKDCTDCKTTRAACEVKVEAAKDALATAKEAIERDQATCEKRVAIWQAHCGGGNGQP